MIPKNIGWEHVIQAIEEIAQSGVPWHRQSVKYNLAYEGRSYPPKYVLAVANKYANGRELEPSEFSSGAETNDFLRDLSFHVAERRRVNNYWLDTFTAETLKEFQAAGATTSGFPVGSRNTVKKVQAGDILLCYVTGLSRWVGALEVTGPSEDDSPIWGEGNYPVRLAVKPLMLLEPEDGVSLEALEGRVSFFEGPSDRGWYKGFLRTSPTLFKNREDATTIIDMLENPSPRPKHYWVEMTHVKGHTDREDGPYKMGAALWSPQLTTKGQEYYAYENMKRVRPGDVILHLPDTSGFSGVSIASSAADSDFTCPARTDWAGKPGYLVLLKDYKQLDEPFSREDFLYGPPYEQLSALHDKYKGLFYHKRDHQLTQGAYLTEAPREVIDALNQAYQDKFHRSLPHIGDENNQIQFEGPRNIMFYGPPGTGKTFKAINRALEIVHRDPKYCNKGSDRSELINEFKMLQKAGRIEFVTFHQAYSYEEFVEGIRPVLDQKNIEYTLHEGVLKRIVEAAHANKSDAHVLIIDEINRGNISKIFGELITLIEEDKREGSDNEISAVLPYSGKPFSVPANLYLIGTMNTADRSIALMDIALRRRFSFEEFMPEYAATGLDAFEVDELNLGALLLALNERITILLDRDHQIGQSFFLRVKNLEDESDQKQALYSTWYRELVPLFQEYFYNDYEKLSQLLGKYNDRDASGFVKERRKKEIENLVGTEEGLIPDVFVGEVHVYEDADALIHALKEYVARTPATL